MATTMTYQEFAPIPPMALSTAPVDNFSPVAPLHLSMKANEVSATEQVGEVAPTFPAAHVDEAPSAPIEEVSPIAPVENVAPAVEEVAPAAPVPEVASPSLEETTPAAVVQEVAPTPAAEEAAPAGPVEEAAPVQEAAEVAPIAPVEEITPIPTAEDIAPVAPVDEVAPFLAAEVTPATPVEEVAPVLSAAEAGIRTPLDSVPPTPSELSCDHVESISQKASPIFNPLAIPSEALRDIAEVSILETSFKILRIIDRYRMKKAAGTSLKNDEGRLKFLAIIYGHIKAQRPVPMCLPAFPFKSPNHKYKVMGTLPDKAEEFALANLNGLCEAINEIYPIGCKLTIISDGLVYNDLLGVPDRDVWAYGETLRELAVAKGYKNICFSRLRDLVSINVPDQLDEMTYVANASNFRRALLNAFASPDWNWEEFSKNEDVCLTYRGYIKFLETDLALVYPLTTRSKSKYRQGIKYIAQQMLARGEAFANAVKQKYPDYVRLSIHPSTGAAKLSVSPLPTTSSFTTPWHCSVAFKLDGTMLSGMRADFENDEKFEMVHENDRPSYFREKSDLLSWGEEKGGIIAEPIYPSGMIIRPAAGPRTLFMEDIDAQKVRALAEVVSPIVLRGFCKTPKRELFIKTSQRLGTPLPWKFGLVLEVKDCGADAQGLNNVLSAEWMPFHFDGLFKTKEVVDEHGDKKLLPNPPKFQFFAGVTSSPKNTGFTLFSSSTQVFRYLPQWLTVDHLSSMAWSVRTSSFEATKMTGLPLVIPHPTTGKPCLRYHEPWPQSKTQFEATDVTIDGQEEAVSTAICTALDELLHDRRVVYYHAWEKGDLVISDNQLMMHTRSDFTSGCERELWRIHFD